MKGLVVFMVAASLMAYQASGTLLVPSDMGENQLVGRGGTTNRLRIGFGSCYDGLKKKAVANDTNILKDILNENLDLWIWLGDFAYVDNKVLTENPSLFEKVLHLAFKVPLLKTFYYKILGQSSYNPESLMRHLFNLTYSNHYYAQLRESIPVIGVWDDHDYGVNDGDATYPQKVLQKQIFLDYMDEPKDSERRNRGDEHGIHQSYRVKKQGYQVLIILIDVRYENNPKSNSILSESQWLWIEETLKEGNGKDDMVLLGSGIQFIMNNRLVNAEHWPATDVQRLIKIIGHHINSMSEVLFLSGDVHNGQIIGSPCTLKQLNNRRFVEVTSSGLTHTCDKNLFGLCRYALKGNTPSKFQISQVVVDFNYGVIEIDLKTRVVEASIKGHLNKTLVRLTPETKPQKAFEYCSTHVFGRKPFMFEGLLIQVTSALISDRNLFLIFGITLATLGLSAILSLPALAAYIWRKNQFS